MDEPHDIGRDQCVAALTIQGQFGTAKALGYLVGQKLLNHVRAAETRPGKGLR